MVGALPAQLVAPAEAAEGQLRHMLADEAPSALLYVPGVHGVAAAEPAGHQVPAGHSTCPPAPLAVSGQK